MGISKGTKHSIGITHKAVQAWVRSASPGDELRAGKGLYLRRTESGAIWAYRYVSPVTGRQVRMSLWGDDERGAIGLPEASLEVATLRAGMLRAAVASGLDPVITAEELRLAKARADEAARKQKDAARHEAEQREQAAALERERRISTRQLFERWCAVDLQPHLRADGRRAGRKDGGRYIRDQFECYLFPDVGDRAAVDVRKADLLAILDNVKAAGKLRTCNVLLADLSQMFAFALAHEIAERNPLDTVTKRHAGGTDTLRERLQQGQASLQGLSCALPRPASRNGAERVFAVLLARCGRDLHHASLLDHFVVFHHRRLAADEAPWPGHGCPALGERILIFLAHAGAMDATKTFRYQGYDLLCCAKAVDGGKFAPALVICRQVWPSRPRVIAIERGDYLTEITAIDAARAEGVEWILNYG